MGLVNSHSVKVHPQDCCLFNCNIEGFTMMGIYKVLLFALIIRISTAYTLPRKNVLFLVSDDMRPNLGAYYGPDFPSSVFPPMHTPNLDGLAKRSLLLKRAYVQVALCSPSRTSLLTGRRPETTHVYSIGPYFRKVGGNFTTIPEYFKNNGYLSVGIGKIFHPGPASGGDDPISWSEPYFHAPDQNYWGFRNKTVSWHAATKKDRQLHELPDIEIATKAIETLKRLAPKAKSGQQPFFLAVGFRKPHAPFIFPEEFLKYYPEDLVRLPNNPYAPVDMPEIAFYKCKSLLKFEDIKPRNATIGINTTRPLPNDVVLNLRRAYYSAISYIDSLVGSLMDQLKILGLDNNTIVSFWGDHGFQLGEHGEWCKETNFELATHAPMMIRIPGLTDNGFVTEELAEFVDLFPTLADAAGLPSLELCPKDSTKVALCREGMSWLPLMNSQPGSNWKDRVFSQYERHGSMGFTMRTNRYRYTEWVKFNKMTNEPDWTVNYGTELYDHWQDPDENWNRANYPEFKPIRQELGILLHKGWRATQH